VILTWTLKAEAVEGLDLEEVKDCFGLVGGKKALYTVSASLLVETPTSPPGGKLEG